MQSNPRAPMKSRASESDLGTLSLTLGMSDGDDDDFQNPSHAISIAQNLILSSLTNPSSQPLSPSNGARSRKRLKPTGASGKENRRIPPILRYDSRVSNECRVNKLVIAEMMNPTAPICSGSAEVPLTSNSDSHVFSDCDQMKSNSRVIIECNKQDAIKEDNLWLLPSTASKLVDNSPTIRNDSDILKDSADIRGFQEGKGSYYSMSIEARLLESRAKAVSCAVEGGCLEGDGCRDFEPGSQLNGLMDLCCEMDAEAPEGSSNSGFSLGGNNFCVESSKLQWNGSVECPLCAIDITGLSEELRQVHTNDCLDKDGASKETVDVGELKFNSPRQVVNVNPVLKWLRTLGLSKYEEAFVREEIDWETLQWLTEEDLLGIGVVTLGPRKKIVHALNELRKRNSYTQDTEKDLSETTTNKNIKPPVPGNTLITEYFQGAAANRNRVCNLSKPTHAIERSKHSVRRRVGTRNYNTKVLDIPLWCCIPGTPFRVDAFRYLRGDCAHWFLTHFHLDHYQGLTRNFCHGKIYCSSITAHVVNMKIGVPWDRLHILPLNQKITVAGVNLTCLDANHCPGSIVILFEPPNGKAVLHTGDFRFSAEMASSSILQSCHVHTLILDTTYCKPQYDFPKQEAVIQFVIEAIQAEAFNPKTLFLIGTYTIGKERLFLEVARLLRKKIYVGAAKLCLLRCLGLPEEDMQWFTANELESQIHVVPMWTIASFKRMKHISNQYSGRFNLIVAFSPTGWTFGKGKKKTPGRRWQQGTIIRYEVPYSEHCSFTELREFVQFISPEHIIPSVNNDGPESVDAMIATLMSDP